ncbi:DUF6783 domain-containing protein [Anaerobutyricum hallii]
MSVFEKCFLEDSVTICGRFCLNEGCVTDYVNRMKANSRMQIEACRFQE